MNIQGVDFKVLLRYGHSTSQSFHLRGIDSWNMESSWNLVPMGRDFCTLESIIRGSFNSTLKMGLLTLIQIPCHYVLANEIALNLKYRIGRKHFFNIDLGIGIIKKKLLFLFVFSTYLPVFLLKF